MDHKIKTKTQTQCTTNRISEKLNIKFSHLFLSGSKSLLLLIVVNCHVIVSSQNEVCKICFILFFLLKHRIYIFLTLFLHSKLYFLSLLFWGVELNGHKCLQNAKMV